MVTVRLHPEWVDKPCPYCGHIMSGEDPRWVPSEDHKTSKLRGGSDDPSNIVIVCSRCNTVKGIMTTEEFMEFKALLGDRFDFFVDMIWRSGARDRAGRRRKTLEGV